MSELEGSREELEKIKKRRQKETELMGLVGDVKEDSKLYEKVVSNLVNEYCDELDEFVNTINRLLYDIKRGRIKNYSQMRLEIKTIELSTAMYKATDGLAILGSQSDAARSMREEKFAIAYGKAKDGTIPDKKAAATEQLATELLVEKIMQRAYQVVAQKVKSANRILEAIKKVITARMIAQEVFRKEIGASDQIDHEELVEGDLEDQNLEDGGSV
jgi:hypothetical protein